MALEPRVAANLRFGTYEVDLKSGELRKQGKRIRLQDQPFRVLSVLLQRPGEVVTRDELRAEIWPEDTFVDFDNGLNTTINKLREALGDSSNIPSFIETLPRRGYRFIAPVTSDGDKASAAAFPQPRRTRSIRVFVLLIVLACLVGGGPLWWWERPHLNEKDTIMLGDFANATGDPVFDGSLRQGLSVQLEQSPFLNILSDERITETLSLMAQPRDVRLTHALAREVCQRTASTAMVEGAITAFGSQYVIGIKAVNCQDGAPLAEEQVTASGKEKVLNALGKAATKMRGRLGESLVSLQTHDAQLETVTTPSLEALQAYSLGHRAVIVKVDYNTAIQFYQRAITLDPNFAIAYARLGGAYASEGEDTRAAENTRKAYELRERVSDREKLQIAARYQMYVTGNLEAARDANELWAQIYPRDYLPYLFLGVIYSELGEFEKAVAASQQALRINPTSGNEYSNLVDGYVSLNRLAEAKATAQEARAHNLDSPTIHLHLYIVDFLQHDPAGMELEAASVMGKPGDEDLMLYVESDTAAYTGQLSKARELARRAAASAFRANAKEAAVAYQALSALREALIGNMVLAKKQGLAAMALSNGRDVTALSALAVALAGDRVHSAQLADNLAKRFPEDTAVQFVCLPVVRAEVVLHQGNVQSAIETMAAGAQYESIALGEVARLPTFVRGEVYLAAGNGADAVAEFQKILDSPSITRNEIIGALAHLGLGRAYVLSGDTTKARATYQNFLSLWKDADPDIPILKKAKAEYAKLQQHEGQ